MPDAGPGRLRSDVHGPRDEPGRDDAGVILAPLPERGRAHVLSSVEITRALRLLKPDVLHVHDPELLTLFPAVRAFVPRLVYDMHEYVPEAVAGKPYLPAKIRPAASQTTAVAQRSLAALGSGVVVVTDDQLAALGSAPKLRLVLPNYPRTSRFEGAEPIASSPPTRASSSSTSAASRAPAAAR